LTGTASIFNILFASSNKHFLPNNPWIQIASNSKVLDNIVCFIYNRDWKMEVIIIIIIIITTTIIIIIIIIIISHNEKP